jgi:excisionase family DNA binding protein
MSAHHGLSLRDSANGAFSSSVEIETWIPSVAAYHGNREFFDQLRDHLKATMRWISFRAAPILPAVQQADLTLLDTLEAANVLRCSVPSLRRLARSAKLRHVRYSRRLFFRRCDLEEFIQAHATRAVQSAG